jgi:Mg-chelatase subunit ChlD
VQVVIKSSKKARLDRCIEKVVMLELTSGDCNTGRPNLDLVAVVDVGRSMDRKKMEQLKATIQFVVLKISPIE